MQKRILAVDDSRTMLETIRISLEKEGYHVDTAFSGEDALALIGTNKYDVIFTDFNMPVMDGLTLTKNIRRTPSHAMVPIIVVTTESQAEKKQQGKNAGATGWMVKPYRPDQLVSIIEKVT